MDTFLHNLDQFEIFLITVVLSLVAWSGYSSKSRGFGCRHTNVVKSFNYQRYFVLKQSSNIPFSSKYADSSRCIFSWFLS